MVQGCTAPSVCQPCGEHATSASRNRIYQPVQHCSSLAHKRFGSTSNYRILHSAPQSPHLNHCEICITMNDKQDAVYAESLRPQPSHAEGHLQKRFSKLTMTGMAFAILNTWIALASTLAIVLPSGGSVAFVYGFIFCVVCNFCIAASMGEMASVWPTAGG